MAFSVGDFAEQLMTQEGAQKRVSPSPSIQPDTSLYSPNVLHQVDISEVHVPDNFVQSIVENKEIIEQPSPVQEDRAELKEGNPLADKAIGIIVEGLGRILDDVKVTLNEVKALINESSTNEVTTVGSIGVNLASKEEEEEEEEEEDPIESVIRRVRKKRKRVSQ